MSGSSLLGKTFIGEYQNNKVAIKEFSGLSTMALKGAITELQSLM